jgi:MFS family permease
MGSSVLTGWALHLHAGPKVVSVLGALPFLAQLVHLPAAWITSAFGERRVALIAVAASRQVYLPLVALPFLRLSPEHNLAVLLIVAALSCVLAVAGNNAWVAWIGELVPPSIRGRWLGRRTALCTAGGTLAALAVGYGLDHAIAAQFAERAFGLLALAACVSGACSTYLMSQQHGPSPACSRPPRRPPPVTMALRPLRDPPFRKVLAFQCLWSAAVGLAAPLFTLHMLINLRMSFALIALQSAGTAAIRVLSAPLWGRAVDRMGARPVLIACSFGISLIPLVWLLPTPEWLWPVAIDSVATGVLWSGQNLASFSLPLTVAPSGGRPHFLGMSSALGGLAFFVASALGGALAEALPARMVVHHHLWFGLQFLFVLSSLARLGAAVFALEITEPRARPVEELVRSAAQGAGQLGLKIVRLPWAVGRYLT